MNPPLGPRPSDPADPFNQSRLFNQSDPFTSADPATPRPAAPRPWWSRRGVLPAATALSSIALVLPFEAKLPPYQGN